MERMYEVQNVKRLHIELSSRCNASCPACSRNYAGGPVAVDLELTELSLDDIKRMVPVEIAKNLVGINFCGNVGDPGMAPDLIPILEYFREQSPKIVQQLRTNGGMRNEKFWTELGEFFVKQPPARDNHLFSKAGVVFSVDGLEDTNHIYRRGVIWEKLIRNMRAYSATGAFAIWEWLLFEHNQHQVEEARALAKELGFQFIVKNPLGFGEYEDSLTGMNVYNKDGSYEYTIWPANFNGVKKDPPFGAKVDFKHMNQKSIPVLPEFSKELEKNSEIVCKSIEHRESKEIYISANGYMLPCCFLGGIFGQFHSSYSRHQFNTMLNDYGLEKFNLRNQSMLDIINGPDFSNFFLEGWKKDTIENGKILYCLETCGHKSAMDKLYSTKTIAIEVER
jgi:MoaA/NifB/PqqE/SkfB family radical SAM enzyme